jgi:hypothetical protein
VLAIGADETLERIAWEDVNLERDKYILQLHPTSFLPKQPAFKFQAVKEILEVSPEVQPYALKLLDYPDLKAVTQRLTAPVDYIEKVTDRMLYGKVEEDKGLEDLFEPPDAFTDIPKALEIARGKLLRAKMDKCPEERLDLLMRYMTECERLAQQAVEGAMPPPPVPPEMAAAGAPGAPAIGGDINISPEIAVPQPMPIPGR